jgi:hypothetical protein
MANTIGLHTDLSWPEGKRFLWCLTQLDADTISALGTWIVANAPASDVAAVRKAFFEALQAEFGIDGA